MRILFEYMPPSLINFKVNLHALLHADVKMSFGEKKACMKNIQVKIYDNWLCHEKHPSTTSFSNSFYQLIVVLVSGKIFSIQIACLFVRKN
jgi:hypothetical protein